MPTLLESFVMPRINDKFPSKAAFANAVLPHKNTNTAAVHLAMILSGKRPAPVDHLEAWVRALELDAHATEEFSFLAGLTHLPPKLHELFVRLFNESRLSRGLPPLAEADAGTASKASNTASATSRKRGNAKKPR